MRFNLTDDIASMLKHLVKRLHIFTMYFCTIEGNMFSRMLPLWATKLQKLNIEVIKGVQFDFLRRLFPKLVKVSLDTIYNLNRNDIVEMLKYIPQVKEIRLHGGIPFMGQLY